MMVVDIEGSDDGCGLPNDAVPRHKTEIPGIRAIVAVVAHHEIVPFKAPSRRRRSIGRVFPE